MRKKTASGVLASLRGSPYGPEYASPPSLAAALLDGLFAHPAWRFSVVSHLDIHDNYRCQNEFFRILLDVVYGRTPENMARLAACLVPYKPYLRGAPPGLPFQLDTATIQRGLNFTLTTELGALDLFGEIPEGGRYEEPTSPYDHHYCVRSNLSVSRSQAPDRSEARGRKASRPRSGRRVGSAPRRA